MLEINEPTAWGWDVKEECIVTQRTWFNVSWKCLYSLPDVSEGNWKTGKERLSYFLIGVAKFSCILLILFIGAENVLHSYCSFLLKTMCQTFLKRNNSISFKIKINFIKSIYTFLAPFWRDLLVLMLKSNIIYFCFFYFHTGNRIYYDNLQLVLYSHVSRS